VRGRRPARAARAAQGTAGPAAAGRRTCGAAGGRGDGECGRHQSSGGRIDRPSVDGEGGGCLPAAVVPAVVVPDDGSKGRTDFAARRRCHHRAGVTAAGCTCSSPCPPVIARLSRDKLHTASYHFPISRLTLHPAPHVQPGRRRTARRCQGAAALCHRPCVSKLNRDARLPVRSTRAHVAGGIGAAP
jgi:hypothetical protein